MWDWALDILSDPLLAPSFVWDAERLHKFNGTSYYVHFYDENLADSRFYAPRFALSIYINPVYLINADDGPFKKWNRKKK